MEWKLIWLLHYDSSMLLFRLPPNTLLSSSCYRNADIFLQLNFQDLNATILMIPIVENTYPEKTEKENRKRH